MTKLSIAPAAAGYGNLRICLAASGGGHVRQLLDLEPVWGSHDAFFVTEDTALGRTLRSKRRTHYLPHFAFGQAKLGAPFLMLWRAILSFFQSAFLIMNERPDLVISSGAGAVFFIVLWGRIFGARVVVMESFARFDSPSLFGRLASPFAHDMIVQSPRLASRYPKAKIFDPLVILDKPAQTKEGLAFATVGATLPFDRLTRLVDQLASEGELPERLILQVGVDGYDPGRAEVHETLPFERVQELLKKAAIVICHGGTGSIVTALREGCQVIAVPRRSDLGEHYDDHQSEITSALSKRGLIQVANDIEELRAAVVSARTRTPVFASTDPRGLIDYLGGVIRAISGEQFREDAISPGVAEA